MQMRGSVAGALWGVVLGGVGLGVASIVADPPAIGEIANLPEAPSVQTEPVPAPAPAVQEPDVEVTEPAQTPETVISEPPSAVAETQSSAPDAPAEITEEEPVAPETQQSAAEPQVAAVAEIPEAASETDSAPGSDTPQDIVAPEADDEPRDLDVASDDRPEVTEAVPEAPAAPQTEAITTEVTTEPDSMPVMAEAVPLPKPEPVTEPTAEIEVAPAPAPPAEVAEEVETTPEVEAAPEREIAEVPQTEPPSDAAVEAPVFAAPPPPPPPPSEPEVAEAPEVAPVPEMPPLATAEQQLAEPETVEPQPAETLPPLVTEAPSVITPPVAAPEETEEQPAQTAEAGQLPQVITTLPGGNSGVRVIRPGAASQQAGTPAEEVTAEAPAEDEPALTRYAAPFENPQGWPMIGVVLLDDGSSANAPALAAALPFPVTVVLDPLQDGVNQRMTAYRNQGLEVGLQVALPFGARAQDVEVAFEAAFDMLPEAVIVYSGGDDLVQSNFAVTEQAVEVLAAEGLGLIAAERGLSSVLRTAAQAEVPAMAVQRSLTDADIQVIGRALDQAAFRARQGTGVVLAGPMTPDMLDALGEWAAKADANQIAMAPASALLSQN